MTNQENETSEPIDADERPDASVGGTAAGAPTAGAEMDEAEHENAVEPEDNSALEVDGPQAGHA